MRFTSFLQEGRLTILLTGEIDHHSAKEYISGIFAKLEAYTPNICILDFSGVPFMDSSGIAVVINALRCVSRMEGKLMATGVNQQPMKVFRASGIDKLIEVKEAAS